MNKKIKKLALAAALVLTIKILLISAFSEDGVLSGYKRFYDLKEDSSSAAVIKAVDNGILYGSYDGNRLMIRPDAPITRSELAAIFNRTFGAEIKAETEGIEDVPDNAWYRNELAKALAMGTIARDVKLRPQDRVTKQEFYTVLARAFLMNPRSKSELRVFEAYEGVAPWAYESFELMSEAGLLSEKDVKLNPTAPVTRAEAAEAIDKLIERFISQSGEIKGAEVKRSLVVRAADVRLKDSVIHGDLIVADGVREGDLVLDNVEVNGRMLIRGGGENSIIIKGSSKIKEITGYKVGKTARIVIEEGAVCGDVRINRGSSDFIFEGKIKSLELVGRNTVSARKAKIESLRLEGEGSKLILSAGTAVKTVEISGKNAEIKAEKNTEIGKLSVSADGAKVSGEGSVGSVEIKKNVIGTSISSKAEQLFDKNKKGSSESNIDAVSDASAKSGDFGGSGADSGNSGGGNGGGASETVDPTKIIDKNTGMPLKYDLRLLNQVSAVRNQFKDGSCRSFAMMGALESHVLKQTGKDYDFSENNSENRHGYVFGEPRGGRDRFSDLAYLFSDKGPILESQDPYVPMVDEKNGQKLYDNDGREIKLLTKVEVVSSFRNPVMEKPAVFVTGMQFLKQIDPAEITSPGDVRLVQVKKAIMDSGAVVSNIYMSHDGRSIFPYSNDAVFNNKTNAYYADGKDGKFTASNHAVAIVGWDDTFSKKNFINEPKTDGAWIVKDAQGMGFADKGFFYVSYNSVTILEEAYVFTDVRQSSSFDGMYYHDELPFSSFMSNETFVEAGEKTVIFNRFKVENDGRVLNAVGFFTTKPGADYAVYLVPKFADLSAISASDNGEFLDEIKKYLIEEGVMDKAGYHLIDLSDSRKLNLAKGEDFAIGVYTRNSDTEDPRHEWDIVMEKRDFGKAKNAKHGPGETYTFSFGRLMDVNQGMSYGNVAVRGYYVQKELPKEYSVKFYDGSRLIEEKRVYEGKSVEPIAEPVKAEHRFVGWYVDEALETQYVFTSEVKADIKLYAKWEKLASGIKHTVTVHTGNNTGFVDRIEVENGKTVTLASSGEYTYHYYGRFSGWYTDASFSNKFDQEKPITEDISIYGKYQPYLVRFDLDDSEMKWKDIAIDMKTGLVVPPVLEGYEFEHWTNYDGHSEFNPEEPVKYTIKPPLNGVVIHVFPDSN